MSDRIRVLLADDHPMFRKGVRAVLEDTRHIDVVAECGDGEAALAAMEQLQPDIAIIDLDMPKKDGIGVAREVQARRLPVKVILLTGFKNETFVQKVLDAGPLGFVLKDGAVTEIVDCVQAVHAGRRFVSAQLSPALLERRAGAAALAAEHRGLDALSPSERRILALVAQGRTSRDIADQLCLSPRTVENHRANISTKLELKGSNALVKFAIEHKASLI